MEQDLVLLERYGRHGDADAFAELTRRYSKLVYTTSLRVLQNPDDALEAAQDSFLKLALNANSIKTSVAAWLHQTARNSALSLRQTLQARRRREKRAAEAQPEGWDSNWNAIAPYIDEALEALPADLKEPLILHYLQGLDQAEVAERLNTSQSTVSRRIEKGISELRAKLGGGEGVTAACLAGFMGFQTTVAAPSALKAALGKLALTGLKQLQILGKNQAAAKGLGAAKSAATAKGAGAAKAVAAGKSATLLGGAAMKITACVVLATAATTAAVTLAPRGNTAEPAKTGIAGSGLAGSGTSGESKPAVGSDKSPMGDSSFMPSPERPVGFRGDGTGRYPAAQPPTVWDRKKSGEGRNIIWSARLPGIAVSSPIIVGPRIYLTVEPHDVVCLEKQSGKVLWIHSCPEFEGLSEEDRKANPAFAEKCAPLYAQLEKANADAVAALNNNTGKGADGALQKRKDLAKQLYEATLAIDKKAYERYWAQGVFGFAGQTPTSDGKRVCAFFTTGVSVCFDLDGNRKWISRGRGGGSEHGNFASPLLIANRLVVWANELKAYDVETGKVAWANPAKGNNTYGSLFRLQVGGEPVAAFQCGYFARARDGKAIWGDNIFGDAVETPIVENGLIYAHVGYPRNSEGLGFKAFKIPANAEGGKPVAAFTFKTEWPADQIPVEKGKSDFDRNYSASPLYVDGLIYRMNEGGGLIVNDATTGAIVYTKVLPMKPITKYWDWGGASASPTLAGKYIYLIDNQGTTVVIHPGREYKEVARNLLEDSSDGKQQSQNLATPVFEGTRLYYRAPGCLYCIGEK